MPNITAVVLAGGKGERLRPFTETLPKALVPINGHPLLYHLLRYLFANGACRVILCTGYKAEAIERFVEEHRRPDWNISCVNSGDVSMTDRILDAAKKADGPYLICYGDTLANVNIDELQRTHLETEALATVSVYPLHSPFGIVNFDGANRVTTFDEKPMLPYWINIGYVLCETAALKYIQPGSDIPAFLSALAESGELSAHKHEGKHLTVNTEKDRAAAEHEMIEFFTLVESGGYER